MPHPAPQGREPAGCNRQYPRPDPGLPDHCNHESMQPRRTPPHRDASPRDATDNTPGRIQGSRITAIMNPCNHAASHPTGARALGMQQTIPQAETKAPRLLLSRIHATMLHPAPHGASPRVMTATRPSRNRAPQLLLSRIPGNQAHLAHGMSPVATGSGGPSGLEDSPHFLAR